MKVEKQRRKPNNQEREVRLGVNKRKRVCVRERGKRGQAFLKHCGVQIRNKI